MGEGKIIFAEGERVQKEGNDGGKYSGKRNPAVIIVQYAIITNLMRKRKMMQKKGKFKVREENPSQNLKNPVPRSHPSASNAWQRERKNPESLHVVYGTFGG